LQSFQSPDDIQALKQVFAVPAQPSYTPTARENRNTMNTFVWKRTIAIALICMFTVSSSALASSGDDQTAPSRAEQQKRTGLYKIVAGLAVASVGLMFVANSHESASVKTTVGTFKASATNKGGMIAGLGLIGGGGFLVYLGAKDRKAARNPSPSLGFSVGRTNGVFLRQQW
jgi:hypothetical protein